MRLAPRLIGLWAGFLLLWFLFVFQFSLSELLVGAASSALTVFALETALRAVSLCFEPRLRWMAQIWRIPSMVANDIWILLKDLCRRLLGRPTHSGFQIFAVPARRLDCQMAAKRALALLFVSTSPNSVVLDVDTETGEMLVHELEFQPPPRLLHELKR